jgi:dipeptidyl aminopeptidase/acylaminoacyl peptidase
MSGTSMRRRGPLAEFLTYRTPDGVQLNALLFEPPEAATRRAMVLVPGGPGGFISGFHDYVPLARRLHAEGVALLLPNMRTAGHAGRCQGMLFGRFAEYRIDIAAAIGALTARGLDRIALFGTSFGGTRMAYYMAHEGRSEAAIRACGLLAAITNPNEASRLYWTPGEQGVFDAQLDRARALLREGRPEEVLVTRVFKDGRRWALTAEGTLEMLGPPGDTVAHTPRWAPAIAVPTLVIHGTADEVAPPAMAEANFAALTGAARRDMQWVEGATHYLEPGWIAEAYAERIAAWVGPSLAEAAR